jgi:PmbA protein
VEREAINMNFNLLKQEALKLGINEIELYSVKSKGIDMSFFDGAVEGNTTAFEDVLCVRGVYNNHIATVYTEHNTDAEIPFILKTIIDNAKFITKEEPYVIYSGDDEYPTVAEKESDFSDRPAYEKIELANKVDKMLKEKCPYTFKTECGYAENEYEYSIVNTNGLNVSKKGKNAYLVAELIAVKDGDMKTSYDYMYIHKFDDIDLEKFTDKIIEDAVSQFGADSVPSNKYNVVLDKGAVRSLLGAYAGVFCADTVLKKMSFLEGKIGEKIFGDNVTIIDDPLNELAISQDTFDDEGVATKSKVIVENGVLKTYLHNLTTAMMMNTKSTGNGFKHGVHSPVAVSPKNFYLQPGNNTLDELFEAIGDGLYITDFEGLHAGVNAISGEYSLKCSGYKVTNGKKAEPVTLIIMSSSIQETLSNIYLIGNDFEFRGGIGASSIALKDVPISGK